MAKKNVCRLVVEDKLLDFKVSGSWRFKELDIENWIEEQKQSKMRDSKWYIVLARNK